MATTRVSPLSIVELRQEIAQIEDLDTLRELNSFVVECCKDAREVQNAAKKRELLPKLVKGTRVRIEGLSPKKLNGLQGVIDGPKENRKDRIPVKLDEADRRYAGSRYCDVETGVMRGDPLTCLEIIED